ncbi:hypothetical protein PRIPAC_93873 [Pristionchus pacificus]|uniref:Uncharacterized protein n=1 Tax=Pristionchus pacificus TaxID=54126 RepID=A0A2A6BBS1_PRIPA|nr:hypothetical protein PRIPAC_93873 [Pristionchus pacificus]|eukprot:PDM63328.1 hypothetical protein PRIPAC_50543 [Pristionchus pacificus]
MVPKLLKNPLFWCVLIAVVVYASIVAVAAIFTMKLRMFLKRLNHPVFWVILIGVVFFASVAISTVLSQPKDGENATVPLYAGG